MVFNRVSISSGIDARHLFLLFFCLSPSALLFSISIFFSHFICVNAIKHRFVNKQTKKCFLCVYLLFVTLFSSSDKYQMWRLRWLLWWCVTATKGKKSNELARKIIFVFFAVCVIISAQVGSNYERLYSFIMITSALGALIYFKTIQILTLEAFFLARVNFLFAPPQNNCALRNFYCLIWQILIVLAWIWIAKQRDRFFHTLTTKTNKLGMVFDIDSFQFLTKLQFARDMNRENCVNCDREPKCRFNWIVVIYSNEAKRKDYGMHEGSETMLGIHHFLWEPFKALSK